MRFLPIVTQVRMKKDDNEVLWKEKHGNPNKQHKIDRSSICSPYFLLNRSIIEIKHDVYYKNMQENSAGL